MNSLTLAERVAVTDKVDYLVLKYLIEKREKFEYVPQSVLKENLSLTEREAQISLLRLIKNGAVTKKRIRGEDSFSITFTGLDIVATKSLYSKKVIKSLGITIGEGKESRVMFGYDHEDNTLAIKYHRIGRKSFKKRISNFPSKNWVSMTLENAKREYEALQCVKNNMGYVPTPITFTTNAVAMEYFEGTPLYRTELSDPEKVLDAILGTMRIAYVYCKGLTHGDLSQFNVLVSKDEEVRVIDWPQATRDEEVLIDDVTRILSYFEKEYSLERDLEEVLDYVKGYS
ncbi:RIO1 family regulatory kinase/ATPase [Metallosphaera sp. D4-4]|uniref:RIO1 family regulatory kinase/ATPase domain-containing protein n=1 Tax=Metallosphaera sp. D4-4 TaxID=3379815 RepID=UPI003908BC11